MGRAAPGHSGRRHEGAARRVLGRQCAPPQGGTVLLRRRSAGASGHHRLPSRAGRPRGSLQTLDHVASLPPALRIRQSAPDCSASRRCSTNPPPSPDPQPTGFWNSPRHVPPTPPHAYPDRDDHDTHSGRGRAQLESPRVWRASVHTRSNSSAEISAASGWSCQPSIGPSASTPYCRS